MSHNVVVAAPMAQDVNHTCAEEMQVAEPGSDKPRGRGKAAPILDSLRQDDPLSPPMAQSGTPPMAQSPMAQLMARLEALLKAVHYLVEQSEQPQVPALLTEMRETIVEAGATWESQGREMSAVLDRIHQQVSQGHSRDGSGAWRWRVPLVSGMIGAVLVGAVWFWWPSPPLAQLGALLNQTMVQQYGQLPKTVQESVTVAYQRTGFRTPAAQQKAGQ